MHDLNQLAEQLIRVLKTDFAGKDFLPAEYTSEEALKELQDRLSAASSPYAVYLVLREYLGSLNVPGLSLIPSERLPEALTTRGIHVRRRGDALVVLPDSFDSRFREGDRILALGKEKIPEIRARMDRYFASAREDWEEDWELPLLEAGNCLVEKPGSPGSRFLFKHFPLTMVQRSLKNTGRLLKDPALEDREAAREEAIYGNTARYPMRQFYRMAEEKAKEAPVSAAAETVSDKSSGSEPEQEDREKAIREAFAEAARHPVPGELLTRMKQLSAGPRHPKTPSFPKGPAPFLIEIRHMESDEELTALLAERQEEIFAAPYLVIDLRDVSGGYEEALFPLIPWLFDEAVSPAELLPETPYLYLYTRDNSASLKKEILSLLADCEEETMELVTELLAELKTKQGAGLLPEMDEVPEEWQQPMESVHYPGKVLLLTDSRCSGPAERMAAAFSRSPKVTCAGRPTYGALDWPHLAERKLSEDFTLVYPAGITQDLANQLQSLKADPSASASALLSSFRRPVQPEVLLPWDPEEAQDADSCLARYLLQEKEEKR